MPKKNLRGFCAVYEHRVQLMRGKSIALLYIKLTDTVQFGQLDNKIDPLES